MGAIASSLSQSLTQIFSDLSPTATAQSKADQIAVAIENAILQGLQVKVPTGKVVIAAQAAVFNPNPIDCELDS
jgi:hypothetical protein